MAAPIESAGSPGSADQAGAVLLRLASSNILHGMVLPAAVADIAAVARWIADLRVDAVALQEVDRGQPRSGWVDQTAAIAEHLGWHHAYAPALVGSPEGTWDVPGPRSSSTPVASYGVGLVSRHRLSAVTVTPLPGGGAGRRTSAGMPGRPGYDREPRTALSATVHADGAALRITTTHLSYLPWRGLRQARAAAGAAARWRGPAVLLGDLNLPVWPVRLLLARPGARGWTHAGGGPTYPAWRPRLQTDQLMVRGGAVVAELVVGPTTTSDHLPVVATVSVPRDRGATGSGARAGPLHGWHPAGHRPPRDSRRG